MNCINCEYFKKSNQYSGYCELWESFAKAEDECSDGKEEDEE